MTVKAGNKSDLYLSAAVATALPANDPTTADGTRTRYTVTAAARRYLDKNTALVVQQDVAGNGVYSTIDPSVVANRYYVEHSSGTIVFETARAVGTNVRIASGAYFTTTHVGGSHSWSAELGVDVTDTTEFGELWRTKTQTVKDGSADVDGWWLDGSMLPRITSGASLILVLYVDYAAGTRYIANARLATESVETATDGVVEDSLSFEFDGAPTYAAT